MADNSGRRRSSARPRVSRSPSPVALPVRKSHRSSVDLGPLGMAWTTYRWILRIMIFTCLNFCCVTIMVQHDSNYYEGRWLVAEALTYTVGLVIAMSKTWHRKRMPEHLFWLLALLLYRSGWCTIQSTRHWIGD